MTQATFTAELGRADAATFTGTAWTALLGGAEAHEPVKLYLVRFEPGARTFWHVHSGPQIIVVTTGRCRYQVDGEAIGVLQAGESYRFQPGVRHWHGAVEDEGTEHIAINLDPRATQWQEEAHP